MRRIKVIFLAEWFLRSNGVSRVVYELAKRMSKSCKVSIAAYKHKIDKRWNREVDVIPIKYSPLKYKNIFTLRQLLLKEKPDIVHSHSVMGVAAKLARLPYISTYHGWGLLEELIHSVGNPIIRLSYTFPLYYASLKLSDKVTTVSKLVQERLLKFGIESEVIPNGVSDTFFQLRRERDSKYRLLL